MNRRKDRKCFLTLSLILINVAVTALVRFYPEILNYAFSYASLLRAEYLNIIFSGFIQREFSHLLWNMTFLLFFGRVVEKKYGRMKFMTIYLSSMIVGNLLFAFMFPGNQAIGASGAIFGLMGAAMLVEPFKDVFKFMPLPLALIGSVYMLSAVFNVMGLQGGVAHIAHLGGGLSGILFAFIDKPEEAERGLFPVLFFVGFVLAFGLLIY